MLTDVERFHNHLDTCVNVRGELFLDQKLSDSLDRKLNLGEIFAFGTASEPFVDNVDLLRHSRRAISFGKRQLGIRVGICCKTSLGCLNSLILGTALRNRRKSAILTLDYRIGFLRMLPFSGTELVDRG